MKCERAAHQTAGPFYIEEPIIRREIAEDQPGRPLTVQFTVVEPNTCAERQGVLLSLFHANAEGLYSGFSEQGVNRDGDTRGQTWLRGAQRTDAGGVATFETIYPGWYTGRVTHMHLTAHVEGKLVHSAQIYFPDKVVRRVYATAPYRGWRDTEDETDLVRKRVVRGVLPRLSIETGSERDFATLTIALPMKVAPPEET